MMGASPLGGPAGALLAHAPEEVQARLRAFADLDARVEATLARARGAWPGVELADDVFVPFVGARLTATAAGDPLEALRVDDLYLACACAQGDARAIEAFRVAHLPGVRAALGRDGSLDQYDEIAQRLMEHLFVAAPARCPAILGYRGRGSLAGYVQITAVRLARRDRRAARPSARGDEIDALVDGTLVADDIELAALKRQYHDIFKRAFGMAFEALSPRERTLMRYESVDGLNIDEIGVIYGVHRATVARWRAKARVFLLNQTRRVLLEELELGPQDFSSVMRLIESQFDVSLSRLLALAVPDDDQDREPPAL